jgi:flagellar protein FliO/FliZ
MDLDVYFRFLIALLFVLGLIGLLAVVARRLGLGYRVRSRPGQSRRLALVEVMPLDAKRRLVLVRRDEVEHLLLLGQSSDVVVEAGIAIGDFAAELSRTGPAATAESAS